MNENTAPDTVDTYTQQHYFSADPAGDLKLREVTVELAGRDVTVQTASGVFSVGELDQGTSILLSLTPAPAEAGNILDIGCGWGAISIDTAMQSPDATIWAIDVNERAREITALNASNLSLSNIKVCAPDEIPADLMFDEIRANPPIRVGKAVLHEILSTWLPHLAPGGVAYLVVAKHLGADSLQKWIAESFDFLDVWREDRKKGFHIIGAERLNQ